ncbi:amino acid permease [Sphingoaurantiacus capsulatus]|uniref:Arginine/agmatine antiporter n=1 Tax=Sphingoaurantiacus capsulatus TaxID=1771310 RepID=A0ABV7XH35_9SPHN
MGDNRDKLGLGLATMLVAGNMIGSGIYLLPASLALIGGISLAGWAVAAVGALLLAAVFGWLAVLRPGADGLAGLVGEQLGRLVGFQTAQFYWLNAWIGNIAIAVAVTGYLAFFFPALRGTWPGAVTTAAMIWVATIINIVGVRFAGRFDGLTLIVGLVPIVAVGVFGWLWFDPALFAAAWNVSGSAPSEAVRTSVAIVFWAFLGMESANVAAAVVKNPGRNVPLATVGGVALAAVVYIAAFAAIMGLLPADRMAASTAPFADAVARIVGPAAAALVAACATAKALGTLNGWVLVAAETTRWTAAAGFLPRWLAQRSAHGTSTRALLAMAALMTVAVLATASPTLGEQFGLMINLAVILSLMVYLYCSLALLRMSGEMPANRRLMVRVVAVLAMLFSLGVALEAGTQALIFAAVLIAVTVVAWPMIRRAAPARPE